MSEATTTSSGGNMPPVTWTAVGAAASPNDPPRDPILSSVERYRLQEARKTNGWLWAAAILIVTLCVAVVSLAVQYAALKSEKPAPIVQAAPVPTPPPYIKISETTSTGGKEVNRSDAVGPSFKGSGDGVKANDAVFGQPKVNSETGSAEGGSLAGDFSSMVKGSQLLVRILGVLVCLGCGALAFLNFKKNPLDWHFTGGLAIGSVGGFITAIEPDFFWLGLIGVGIAGLMNFWPSIMASKLLSAGQVFDDFLSVPENSDIKARWVKYRDGVARSDKNTIDFIKSTNT